MNVSPILTFKQYGTSKNAAGGGGCHHGYGGDTGARPKAQLFVLEALKS